MKVSEFRKLIREEIRKAIKEDGSESLYYTDAVGRRPSGKLRMQHIDDVEKWKITAMQIGAIVKDRGDDWIAVMPNQDVLGTYSKVLQSGELAIYA